MTCGIGLSLPSGLHFRHGFQNRVGHVGQLLLGHALGFQLLFQHLDIAAGLCRVDLQLIQVEGGLGFFVAQQLGNDGVIFCEAAVEVSGSGGTLGGAFLNACRVDASLPLLRDTALSMEDISHRVGFSSASRYSKVFKQHKGVSPLQYRKAGRF